MKRIELLLVMACLAISGFAKIDVTVDTENLVFTGINLTNNYTYVISVYEFSDNGPQFQLTVNPVDATKPAQFTADDLQDENYWEPLFKYYTQMIAGEEMTAQDNIKRLYLGDVQLLQGQFSDYNQLHIIGFDLSNDYYLPKGCLQYAGDRLETVEVKCDGTMSLGENSIPANKFFDVFVSTEALRQTWESYKQQYGCQYAVTLQEPEGISSFTIIVNGEEQELPASGMPEIDLSEGGTHAEEAFVINGFTATTTMQMQSLRLMGSLYEYGSSPTEWRGVDATMTGDGLWQASGLELDLLEGLERGRVYVLELYVVASDDDTNYYFNNDGLNYKVIFMPGEGQHPVTFYTQETAGLGLLANGVGIDFVLNGDGTKSPDAHLGSVSSLAITDYWVRCQRESNVELSDVSLQWRVLDVYSTVIDGWNRVDFQDQSDEGGDKHKKYFWADNLDVNLLQNCQLSEDYILEVMYQLIDANTGNYYFFARDAEVGRFYFTYVSEYIPGDVNGDGSVDVGDINIITNIMLGLEAAESYDGRANVDGDGGVDISDLNFVTNIMLGM